MKLDPRWEKVDDGCYRLLDNHSFPGTRVYVDLKGTRKNGYWRIRLVNTDQLHAPSPKEPWFVVSRKSWRNPSNARNMALAIRYSHQWLLTIGIDVHDEKYKGVVLAR